MFESIPHRELVDLTGPICRAQSTDHAAIEAHAAAIRTHPAFAEALDRYAATALDAFDSNWRDAKVACQTARFALLVTILYLDATADPTDPANGPSVSRLQELFAIGGHASPSWVKVAVRMLHRMRYVEYRPPGPDRRQRLVRPGARLIALGERAVERMLEAVATVDPLPAAPADLARSPGFLKACVNRVMRPYVVEGRTPLEGFAEMHSLLAREFGYLIFTCLVRTMRRDASGAILAKAPSGELARRFGVSRAQVRNVLGLAAGNGWLTVVEKGGHLVRLAPGFAEACERWVATDLAWWCHLTRGALADVTFGGGRRASATLLSAGQVRPFELPGDRARSAVSLPAEAAPA